MKRGDAPDGMSIGSGCALLSSGETYSRAGMWNNSQSGGNFGRWDFILEAMGSHGRFQSRAGTRDPSGEENDPLAQGDGDNTDRSVVEKQGARGSRDGTWMLIKAGNSLGKPKSRVPRSCPAKIKQMWGKKITPAYK